MTNEERKALVERLRKTYVRSAYAPASGTGTPIVRRVAILKEEVLINPTGPEAADLIEAQAQRIEALTIALHDAICRPMGQVPESADPFYSPALADQAEQRRMKRRQALAGLAEKQQ